MLGRDTEPRASVNLSLPESVVERYHYEARYHDEKRKFEGGSPGPDVSVGYSGDELGDDAVSLVENYISFLLWRETPRYF